MADFSRILAGPLAAVSLADLGATVIKVERPGTGDDTRSWGPPWITSGAAYFESANRSKLSVTLDLANQHDLHLAKILAQRADVLLENFKPGTLGRYGLSYDDVARINPRLVYCSISGFGNEAGSDLLGYDFVVQAAGGLMSITGEEGGPPIKTGVALVDVLTSKDAVIGILSALSSRDRYGTGCRIEVNLLSSLLAALVNQAQSFLTTGQAPERMGNQHPSIAPYESLRCRDGMIVVACGNDGQFHRLCFTLGLEELSASDRFATNAARVAHRPELIRILESRLVHDDAQLWQEKLTKARVPAHKVGTIADAFALATELQLSPTVPVGPGHPEQVRNPVSFTPELLRPPQAPPALGEHDRLVREWLGDANARAADLA